MACMKFLLSHCMPCWPPRRSFPRSLRECYKILTFFEESSFFFLIIFLWTRRMQWLQPRRRVFNEELKIFRSKYKIGKKNIYFKKTVGIKILLSRWMQSWLHRRSFPRSLREWYKNFFSSAKFIFYCSSIRSYRYKE